MHFVVFGTKWGSFGFVARGNTLTATYMLYPESQIRRRIRKEWPESLEAEQLMSSLQNDIRAYFAGDLPFFDVKVDVSGFTPFAQSVLSHCRRIEYGETSSYAELAKAAGKPGAARAVGGVMARNPLPLIIPCHRVLRSDGKLGGFTSPKGIRLKERMLKLECSRQTVKYEGHGMAGVGA